MTLEDTKISKSILLKAFKLMFSAKYLTEKFEENTKIVSKYVHATSRGHEAIQIAAGLQLNQHDFLYPYYRDDSLLLSIGMQPYDLMLQVFAKKDDPFSAGKNYYSHPSLKDEDKPNIPNQGAGTGMQMIPATGAALGLKYKAIKNLFTKEEQKAKPIVVCSIGDAAITEGECAEALQMASLKQLPILYLVQDNEWDISATAEEIRSQNAAEYADGFKGIEAFNVDGSDFTECYNTMKQLIEIVRNESRPILVRAFVPLLNHHTSGVRMEWYRNDLEEDKQEDPFPVLYNQILNAGIDEAELEKLKQEISSKIDADFETAKNAQEPNPDDIEKNIFAPFEIEEQGTRKPEKGEQVVMVDSALHALEEIMKKDDSVLFYGQDVGARLGGVFREAATLAQKFGDERVFNTPIQEAFIIGSTAGMSAVGLKPIVEVQFADYIFPGMMQLYSEVSKSCYLSNGKYPVNMILRVPCGAYGSGGPYHSASVESIISNIKGIKVAFPSNGADFKGLMKAAYHDPNPIVMFEHKGLYWSKVPGTEFAKQIEPDENYILPFGKAKLVLEASDENISKGNSLCIVTYGMGVHWSLNAAKNFKDKIAIIDLRTLIPLDKEKIFSQVKLHNKCIVLTEECIENSFARNLSGLIQENCFEYLDAPIKTIGSLNLPAIPLNSVLEEKTLPNAKKLSKVIEDLLVY